MSEETEETIVVTGARLSLAGATGGANAPPSSAYFPPDIQDPFEQEGGDETVTTVSFSMIEGDVVVRLPGYDFPIKVPAAAWERMSNAQKGAFIKLMTEFSQAPELVSYLDHLKQQGVSAIEIHFDDDWYTVTGNQNPFPPDVAEMVQWAIEPGGADETDMKTGTKVVITINSDLVSSTSRFVELVIHALGHPTHGLSEADEAYLSSREGHIYSQIFNTPGEQETSPQDYYDGTTIIGSRYDDNVTGGSGNDTLSGLSGNDILNGGAGNDVVMGGAGMDRLSGGLGDNIVFGGLDADTYVPSWGPGSDYVVELGGVDLMNLASFAISDCWFSRVGDTLTISLPSGMFVIIENQWFAGSKVEQFVFADGTFASSYIEYLAENGGSTNNGLCYDENGQQIFCSPFGMPVVFDLDGDGVELVSISRSRVRFDMNGDGTKDRSGWIGADDGILALDRNHNGRIDDFSEISFVHDFRGAATDLEGLLAYDSNSDGFLTKADARFDEFLIWRDSNGNGKSEKHELVTLGDLGIVSISLERSNLNPLRAQDQENQILGTSIFETSDGKRGLVGDVALFVDIATLECGCHVEGYSSAELLNIQLSGVHFDGLIP